VEGLAREGVDDEDRDLARAGHERIITPSPPPRAP
jgi:hypothetical protein